MEIIPFRIKYGAYGIYSFGVGTPYWNYVNVWGKVYDCNDLLIIERDMLYGHVELEGEFYKLGEAYAKIASPLDIRTFEMIKAGCCPPGLTNLLLPGGPG